MTLRQARNVTVVAVAMLASLLPFTVAEEATPAVRVEADLARSCYAAHAGFGSWWMLDGNEFYRVDLRDNSVRRVPVNGLQSWHGAVTVGNGAVWIGDTHTTVYKIDPQKEQVVQEVRVELDQPSTAYWSLAAAEGAVWVLVGNEKLGRYSATSGAEEAVIRLPSNSSRVLVAFGSVWVTGTGNDELYRIDPTTNQIVATIELRARPTLLAAGDGAIWVFNERDGTIQRIDGKSGKQLATIETEAVGQAQMTFGGGFVWVVTVTGTLIQVDPHTNSVRHKLKAPTEDPVNTYFFGIADQDSSLWMCGIALKAAHLAYRIAPPM